MNKLNKLEKIIYYAFIIFIILFSVINLVNANSLNLTLPPLTYSPYLNFYNGTQLNNSIINITQPYMNITLDISAKNISYTEFKVYNSTSLIYSVNLTDYNYWNIKNSLHYPFTSSGYEKNVFTNFINNRYVMFDSQNSDVSNFYIYNGTQWILNNTYQTGLNNISECYLNGAYSSRAMSFNLTNNNENILFLIDSNSNKCSYIWNNDKWYYNSSYLNGLSSMTEGDIYYTDKIDNKKLFFYIDIYDNKVAYEWNGIKWILNNTYINGLPSDLGVVIKSSYYFNVSNDRLTLITNDAGTFNGLPHPFYIYEYDNVAHLWINSTIAKTNLLSQSSNRLYLSLLNGLRNDDNNYLITTGSVNGVKSYSNGFYLNYTFNQNGIHYYNATTYLLNGTKINTETYNVYVYSYPEQRIKFNESTEIDNSTFIYSRNYINSEINFYDNFFNYSKISLYKNNILYSEIYNYNNLSTQSYNFTNLSNGIYKLNGTITNIYNMNLSTETRTIIINDNVLPYEVDINLPLCDTQYTLQNTQNTSIYFDWTSSYDYENESIYYKLYLYRNPYDFLINDYITETYYNHSFLIKILGDYYIKVYSCDSLNCSVSTSNCTFNICKNDYKRVTKPCIDNLRLIEYYDANNCNEIYDFPLNNGTYEDCTIATTYTFDFTESQLTILMLSFLILVSIVIGFKYSIGFYGTSFLFGLLTAMLIYFEYPSVTFLGSIIMTLLFVVIAIFKKD